jgi:hypothetical protein
VATIRVDDVPADLMLTLLEQAALRGLTVSEYVRDLLVEAARRPTPNAG